MQSQAYILTVILFQVEAFLQYITKGCDCIADVDEL